MSGLDKEEELFHLINTNGTSYEEYLTKVNQITNINFSDSLFHRSYLHVAIQVKREDIISDLLKRGIDVNIQDKKGNTASNYLIANEDWNGLERLLPFGVNPNLKNNFNNTLLWDVLLQTSPGSPERYNVVKNLLEIGADPENINSQGKTPLSLAILQKDENVIAMLKEYII